MQPAPAAVLPTWWHWVMSICLRRENAHDQNACPLRQCSLNNIRRSSPKTQLTVVKLNFCHHRKSAWGWQCTETPHRDLDTTSLTDVTCLGQEPKSKDNQNGLPLKRSISTCPD